MITYFVLAYNCSTYLFEHEPVTTEDTNIVVDISPKGFQQYIDKNLDLGVAWLQTVVLPEIDLEIAGFSLVFSDLLIGDVIMPKIKFSFLTDGCDARFSEWVLNINFRFLLQQNTYPYLYDDGPGKLHIGLEAAAQLFMYMAPDCPYHIGLRGDYFDVEIFDMSVKMEGKLGWLYDSILVPLTDALKEIFSGYMGQLLAQAIIEVANTALYAIQDTSGYGNMKDPNGTIYHVDQRWTRINVDSSLHAQSPGQICKPINGVCGGIFLTDKPTAKPAMSTNRGLQYYISRYAFQSVAEWYRIDYYKDELFGANFHAAFTYFANTGAVMQATSDDTKAEFLVTIKPGIITNTAMSQMLVFRLVVGQRLSCTGARCDDASIAAFVDAFNTAQDALMLSYNNGNGVDGDNCSVIYASGDWVLVSCDMKV